MLCSCEVGVADALLKIALNDIGMSRHFEDVTMLIFLLILQRFADTAA